MPLLGHRLGIGRGLPCLAALTPIALLLAAGAARAQAPLFIQNPNASEHDGFGTAVDVDGDVAIVGAPSERTNGAWTGAAYVYRLQTDGTWALEATLQPADFSEFDLLDFGRSVSISGDVAAVTAPGEWNRYGTGTGDDDTRGSVYVFRHQGDGVWALETELFQGPFGDILYGLDVDVEGDALVVGAKDRFVGPPGQGGGGGALVGGDGPSASSDICHADENSFYELGRAEVVRYDGSTWARTDALVAPDSLIGGGYGVTVSLDGDAVVVGAPYWYTAVICGDAFDADEVGRAYVFRQSGGDWAFEATLAPDDLQEFDQFAHDVAVSGSGLVAGAPYRDGVSVRSGAAFAFAYDGAAWVEEEEFVGESTLDGDYFGFAVDLEGDFAVVGAPRYRNGDLNLGATYGFMRTGGSWQQGFQVTYDEDLSESNPVPINFAFGQAVALDAGHVLIGAPEFGDYDGPEVAIDVGAAFSYTVVDYFRLSGAIEATIAASNPPVVVPAEGGPVSYTVSLQNTTETAQTFQGWIEAVLPDGRVYGPLGGPRRVRLGPDDGVGPIAFVQTVPAAAPAGVYTVRLRVGAYPSLVVDEATFTFTKAAGSDGPVAAARADGGSLEDWLLYEAADGPPLLAEATGRPAEGTLLSGTELSLAAHPNPFARQATIHYSLAQPGPVRLAVYDALGREVAVLEDRPLEAGSHVARLEAGALPAGTYLVRLHAGRHVATQQVTLLR